MSRTGDKDCRSACWLVAGGLGGLLCLVLLFGAAFSIFTALVVGLVTVGALGLFLAWAFCRGPVAMPVIAAAPAPPTPAPPTPAPPTPAPRPAPRPLTPAPAPVPMPDPVVPPAPPPAAADVARPAKAAAKSRAGAEKPPKAAGIDAAMGRTKETVGEAAPLLLLAPRDGKADDLKEIVGVGPVLERLLNEVGVWHFDQIASWKARDIAFVDARLKTFKGRITRDGWVKQARALARRGQGQ